MTQVDTLATEQEQDTPKNILAQAEPVYQICAESVTAINIILATTQRSIRMRETLTVIELGVDKGNG